MRHVNLLEDQKTTFLFLLGKKLGLITAILSAIGGTVHAHLVEAISLHGHATQKISVIF